jgi:exonuclease III
LLSMGLLMRRKKTKFHDELGTFCDNCKDPYIVGGDFNIIRASNEKNKPSGLNKHIDQFNMVI